MNIRRRRSKGVPYPKAAASEALAPHQVALEQIAGPAPIETYHGDRSQPDLFIRMVDAWSLMCVACLAACQHVAGVE